MTILPKKKSLAARDQRGSVDQRLAGTSLAHHDHHTHHHHHHLGTDAQTSPISSSGSAMGTGITFVTSNQSTSRRHFYIADRTSSQDGVSDSLLSTEHGDLGSNNRQQIIEPLRHRQSTHYHRKRQNVPLNVNPNKMRLSTISPSSSHHLQNNINRRDASSHEGYNSEDEYQQPINVAEFSEDMEQKFEEKVKKSRGYIIKRMKEDGACLFRAAADQVYGDEEMHGVVRKLCMDYMAKNADHFSQFVTEDFNLYIARKRMDSAHGNHAEIQALAEIYNRPIEVYQYSLEPINTFYTTNKNESSDLTSTGVIASSVPIRVSYHRNMHYNSLVDPNAATIGVGLGLPQFYPGSADKNLIKDAVVASEQDEIEKAMLKDKLKATDWEATDEQMQEQVARESYLEWIRSQEKLMKESVTSNRGESTVTHPISASQEPKKQFLNFSALKTTGKSPDAAGPSNRSPDQHWVDSEGDVKLLNQLSSSLFDMTQYEDDSTLLDQVLAISRQEYFDQLAESRRVSKVEERETLRVSNDDDS